MADISDSSSSSSDESLIFSSSEDEMIEIEDRERPKNENYIEGTVAQYNEEEFLEHFRVSRRVSQEIANLFEYSEVFSTQTGGNGKISALHQVFIYLWFAGHQTSSFRDVADRFNITISTLFRVIKRLTLCLSNLSRQIIKWPTEEEKVWISQQFTNKRFPGVIGVIDGTHVKIDQTPNDADSYLNRKKYYSIQAQIVCDNQKKIRDIFVGYPGSVHDSRVYRTSPLSQTLAEKCGNDYFILGDSGYPCERHLITPFKNHGNLTRAQIEFNSRLSGNRYIVEHCFGHLKQKFRQLYHVKLRKIETVVHFIRACCVLHNLSLDDDFMFDEIENVNQLAIQVPENENLPEDYERDDVNGIQFRNILLNNIL